MPVPVVKYTCKFKCGAKAVGDQKRMDRHEDSCWKNPDNKTCKTCINQVYYQDGDDCKAFAQFYRGCKLDPINDVLDEVQEVLRHQNSVNVRPIYKCPFHNKSIGEGINDFATELKEEILGEEEGTIHYPFFNKPPKDDKSKENPGVGTSYGSDPF